MHAADNDGIRKTIASACVAGVVGMEGYSMTYPGVKKVTVSIV